MKKFWKILLIVLAVLLAAVVLLFAWLTITEYRPDPVTELDVVSSEEGPLIPSDRELSIMSWNIGYAGLGEDSDFFMDGGTGVQSADKEQVLEYLGGVEDADELLRHIRELVELENGINFTGNEEIAIVLTEDELAAFIADKDRFAKCRRLYMGHDLLPDEAQETALFKNKIEISIIPDYYYRDLQEG